MFSFFGQIINFLGSLISWIIIIIEFFVHGIRIVGTTVSTFAEALSGVPLAVSALILFMIAIMIFDFIRGR